MIKFINFILIVFLTESCNLFQSIPKTDDYEKSQSETSYIKIVYSYKMRVTEYDIQLLFNNSLNNVLPLFSVGYHNPLIIPQEKFLEFQHEFERINKFYGVNSDSLAIDINIYEKGNKIKDFRFDSDIQVLEFIKMMHGLLGEEDGYVPIERYLKKTTK